MRWVHHCVAGVTAPQDLNGMANQSGLMAGVWSCRRCLGKVKLSVSSVVRRETHSIILIPRFSLALEHYVPPFLEQAIADVYCLETRSSLGRHEHPYDDSNTKSNYDDPEVSSESANETKRSSEDSRLLPPPNEHTRCDSRETLGRASRTGVDALPPSYPRDGHYAAPICAPSTVIISATGAGQKSSPVGVSSRSSIPSDMEASRSVGDGRRLSNTGDVSGVFRSYRSHGSSSGSGLGGGGGGSYLSPNPTGRWSEESRSVSWCSDNCLSSEHFGTSSSSNGGGGEDSSSPPVPPPPPPLPPPPPSERLCRRPQAPL